MSADQTLDNSGTNETENPEVNELTLLKQRARMMGITFSNNIGLEALKEKIQAKMDGKGAEDDMPKTDTLESQEQPKVNALTGNEVNPVKPKNLRQYLIETQMKLVRLRITNMDPKKKDLPGEIFTVANDYLGTVRKYIPYGEVTDDGWHVPYCIYTELESRRFLNIRTFRDKRTGQTRVETSWAKEFALEVLPPLTKEELHKLAQAQLASGSIGNN